MPETLPMTTKHCTVERDGNVVIFTMNRPEARNALSPDMLVSVFALPIYLAVMVWAVPLLMRRFEDTLLRDGRTIEVQATVTLLRGDGTPILDLKPYIPYADAFPDAKAGWIDAIPRDAPQIRRYEPDPE